MVTSRVRTAELSDEQLQALVEVVLAVAYGDAHLGDAERRAVSGALSRLGDERLDDSQVGAVLLAASLNLERDGTEARLRAARRVLADEAARHTALRLAYGVAEANGLARGERTSLHRAAAALDVDPDALEPL